MREHYFDLESVDLTADYVGTFDAVILLTDHSEFDYEMILKNARLIIDTRGKFRGNHPNVRRA
ncbi:MAG: hypothetical protein ABJ214_19695 [Roseobacter sp.]